jgi:hypothetical protein
MIWNLSILLWIQSNLDALSKWAQVSLAILAYLGVGGSISGFYLKARLTKFEKELFEKLDSKFVPREICKYRHGEPDSGEYHPRQIREGLGEE